MEVTIVVDVLRRANIEVLLAGLQGTAAVTCSRGMRLLPDCSLTDVQGLCDAIVLPGGAQGASELAHCAHVGQLLRAHHAAERIVAAICAAPTALLAHQIGVGMRVTCHPSVRDALQADYEVCDERVVHSPPLLTSQGPGTSFEFALTLVRLLVGSESAVAVAKPMLLLGEPDWV